MDELSGLEVQCPFKGSNYLWDICEYNCQWKALILSLVSHFVQFFKRCITKRVLRARGHIALYYFYHEHTRFAE